VLSGAVSKSGVVTVVVLVRSSHDCFDGIEEDEIEVKQIRGMSGDRYSPGTGIDLQVMCRCDGCDGVS